MILSHGLAEITTILQYVVENLSFYSISVQYIKIVAMKPYPCARLIKFDKESRESSVVNDVHSHPRLKTARGGILIAL